MMGGLERRSSALSNSTETHGHHHHHDDDDNIDGNMIVEQDINDEDDDDNSAVRQHEHPQEEYQHQQPLGRRRRSRSNSCSSSSGSSSCSSNSEMNQEELQLQRRSVFARVHDEQTGQPPQERQREPASSSPSRQQQSTQSLISKRTFESHGSSTVEGSLYQNHDDDDDECHDDDEKNQHPGLKLHPIRKHQSSIVEDSDPTGTVTTNTTTTTRICNHYAHAERRECSVDEHIHHHPDDKTSSMIVSCCTRTREGFMWNACYIAAFSIFGTILRIYLGRLFGMDCEAAMQAADADADSERVPVPTDWFFSVAQHICITTSGQSSQTGGALFLDLPANMLGCFVIGLLSPPPISSVETRRRHVPSRFREDVEIVDVDATVHQQQQPNYPPIPWFRFDHPLQQHEALRNGLTVGFCGCLTTFASWNTQMIIMIDGTFTVLGSQVPSALFGYLLGIVTAVGAFDAGRHAYSWFLLQQQQHSATNHNLHLQTATTTTSIKCCLIVDDGTTDIRRSALDVMDDLTIDSGHQYHHQPNGNSSVIVRSQVRQEKINPSQSSSSSSSWANALCVIVSAAGSFVCAVRYAPFVAATMLVVAFGTADAQVNQNTNNVVMILFYRKMWLSCLLSPLGALLRWQWAIALNPTSCSRRPNDRNNKQYQYKQQSYWMPWGTYTANVVAAIVSILVQAMLWRYLSDNDRGNSTLNTLWMRSLLQAIETGFAGSLSTVSTWIRELRCMQNVRQAYYYGAMTVLTAMLMGLIVYSPIVRS